MPRPSSGLRLPRKGIAYIAVKLRPWLAAFVLIALGGSPAAMAAIHSRFPPVELDSSSPQPTIAFDRTRYDFGPIAAGRRVEHTFIVTNTGRAILRLEKPLASCGCTSAAIGRQELKPGESTEIVAIYTPEKGFVGAMRRSILVVSNDPKHRKLTLRLAGDVLAPDKFDPTSRPAPVAPGAAAGSEPPGKAPSGSPR